LGSMLPAKQFKIAGETLYLYAPLAHRLGLFSIKTELEDLSFKYEHPQEYDFISAKLKATEESRNKLFERFAAPVDEKLKSMGLQYEMRARVKSVYSIWNKKARVSLSRIFMIFMRSALFLTRFPVWTRKINVGISTRLLRIFTGFVPTVSVIG